MAVVSSPQYFTCLLLILIAQITAGALIYFQKDVVSVGTPACGQRPLVLVTGT